MQELKFPKGFLWGSSTSAYQIEGGIENNDWAKSARDGKVLDAGKACDGYHRYKEDFDIAKSLGQNAHRFSIEWSRIEPEEGKFDEHAIQHYREVLQALRDRGLEPFVTLWHFTLPIWFAKKGGFENKNSPEIFARYCEYIVGKLGDSAKFWITINEPNVYGGNGSIRGIWPPFKKNIFTYKKIIDNLIMSHNVVYKKIKNSNHNLQVGIAADLVKYIPNHNPLNQLVSSFLNWLRNRRFLDKTQGNLDFIGVNYYRPVRIASKSTFEQNPEMENWEIYPQGLHDLLLNLKRYNKPVYITENGIADAKDQKRAKFIKDHLYWLHKAIQDGVDVRGYFYWSLLDNFEWSHGFKPRFGLIEMNYDTMERCVRQSAYEYKKICESNTLIFNP